MLRTFSQTYVPNMVFLMETKANNVLMENSRVKLGFSGKWVVNCDGRKGGLGLFWSNEVVVNLLSFSLFHIDV